MIGGFFEQQPAATIAPRTPVLTLVPTPIPEPLFGQIAPKGQVLPPTADDDEATLHQPTSEQVTGPIMDPNKATGSTLGPELADEGLPPPATEGEQGQVLSKEDDDDDGPVPPECPLTGPIPPHCTMKPKFPDERALE